MLPIKELLRRLPVVVFTTVALAGCAVFTPAPAPQPAPEKQVETASTDGWRAARFRMHWPADTEPEFYLDLMIAHRIVAPVLARYRDNIQLWRFHRRAARDAAGHQFSFIFFSSAATARRIYADLQSDLLLAEMKSAGIIVQAVYDNPDGDARPRIEDTSDPHWPEAVRKSWPYYIAGASRMWLKLVDDVAGHTAQPPAPSSLAQILAFYRRVNTSVTALWQEQGRHAYLHHLNALFGYRPLVYYEKRWLSF